jgi:NADH-quinone oxidoreductase subunit L
VAHDLPAYVPWILFLPAIAGVIQHFVGKRLPRRGDWLVIGAMAGAAVLSFMVMAEWAKLPGGHWFAASWDWFTLAGGKTFAMGIVVDGLTAALLCVVGVVATLVFLFSAGYMKGDEYYDRFFLWLSCFAVAMLILTVADNLLLLFIGWELVGLCSYKLIGFWSKEIPNAEAAKKAFITTRVGDVGMLIGMMILYANCGTLHIGEIFAQIREGAFAGHETLLTWAGIGVFFGAVGKSAQFPLHVWLPDAMAGPTPVSALIHAATMVAAGVYLSARMFPMFTPDALGFIAWTGGITAFIAALVAFTATDIKKVLAYSTISQLGYMILGVGVGAPWAAMFHLATHAMFKACLFLGSGSVIHAMHHAQDLKDMGGLAKKMPVTFATFAVSTLALAGVPFFSGFLSKDAILIQAWESGNGVLFYVGLFAAFLTAFYMARLVWLCFFGKPKNQEKYDHAHESPWTMTVPLVILAAISFSPWWTGSDENPGFADKFFRAPAYLASFPETHSVEHTYWAGGVAPEHFHEGHGPGWFHAVAMALGLIGIGVGVSLFWSGKRDEKTRVLPKGVHELALNKYFMDEMYLDGFVANANRVSDACDWIDRNVVDGIVNTSGKGGVVLADVSGDADQIVVDGAVNLTADVAQGAGAVVATAQTGRIRNYLAAAIGVTALAVVILVFVIG